MKEKIAKLIDFIYLNNVSIQKAGCFGLDLFSSNVCQQACQKKQVQCIVLNFADKNEIKNNIESHNLDTIFILKKDIRSSNELLWECDSLKQFICVDTDDLAYESDGKSKLMNKKLWDYTANNAVDDIEGGGWVSSYTRENFSLQEMSEYVQNVIQKLSPYLNKSKRILEIGCSSGLTMYALAQFVEEYIALDMSSCIIKKNNDKILRESIKNIKLYCLYAHELQSINEENFDIGIINSVIHCFEGHLYLKRILRMLIDKMGINGIIFLGDIMDAGKKNAFEKSLKKYKNDHDTNTKVDISQELFLSRGFIEDLYFDFPEINHIEISNKHHTIENELTKYRYDVLIKLNKHSINNTDAHRNKYQYSCDISQGVT